MRVPDLPQPQLPATAWTDAWIAPKRRAHPLPIPQALPCIRLTQIQRLLLRNVQRLHQLFADFLEDTARLEPILPNAVKPLRQDMLHHPPDERLATYRLTGLLAGMQVIAIPLRDSALLPIIGNNP